MLISDSTIYIITPAYNVENFIAEAIQSVQQQTHSDWQLLIVDDGSEDSTAEVVTQYLKEDSRIQLIRQQNCGPAMARQAGLDCIQGRYIAFLDGDDSWLPEKLERQLNFMKSRQAAITFTAFRRMTTNHSEIGHLIKVPKILTYKKLLGDTAIATSTVLIDRSISGEFKFTNTYYDDFALWLDILKRGHVGYGVNDDLMRYRVVNSSVSRNKVKSAYMVWKTYRNVEKLSLPISALHFIRYIYNAWRKYRQF